MKYFFYDHSDSFVYQSIENILFKCRQNGESIYELNEDSICDFDVFVLASDNFIPVGFAAASIIDESSVEIIGAVIPDTRQRGIFREMLENISSRIKPKNIVFSGKENYNGFSACANALGYSDKNTEHLMSFDENLFIPAKTGRLEADYDEEDATYYYYSGDALIGSCSIYDGNSVINIYDVFVEPEYRKQGYGCEIIADVLWDLTASGKTIQLQVSGQNEAALRLYDKCGFTITDTLVIYGRLQKGTI